MFSFQGASRQRKLHILRCASFRSMTGRFAPCVMSRFGNDFFKSFHELSLNEVLNPLRTSFNESSSFFAPVVQIEAQHSGFDLEKEKGVNEM